MNDRTDNKGAKDSEPLDLALAREIRKLPRSMAPSRELWSGIERRIMDHPQRMRKPGDFNWMPYGIAASLVIATLSLAINLGNRSDPAPEVVSFGKSIDHLQAEYLQVRNPLVTEFGKTNESLEPAVLEDLYRNIEIMEQARREIEEQVRKNPENRRLVEMLMSIHEQEIELLKRDYTQPTRSM